MARQIIFAPDAWEDYEFFLQDKKTLLSHLLKSLRDFVQSTGGASVCLGLSGGIDSALVAALCTQALGADKVVGIRMPSQYSSAGSLDDARALADNLGITCHTVPVTPLFAEMQRTMQPLFAGTAPDVTEENMQSRLRGIILMSFANKFNHLVMSTGNKSEALVGYCTMYGDTCGAVMPIGSLYKTTVFELARYINEEKEIIPWNTINKPPSAELRPEQIDEDSLPPYSVLDPILQVLVDDGMTEAALITSKRFDSSTVAYVARLVRQSAWKRAQLPPSLAIN